MTDMFGRELHVGDYVISMDQKYPILIQGRVAAFTKNRATVRFKKGVVSRKNNGLRTKTENQIYKYADADGTPCYPLPVNRESYNENVCMEPMQSFIWGEHACPGDEDTILSILMDEDSGSNDGGF